MIITTNINLQWRDMIFWAVEEEKEEEIQKENFLKKLFFRLTASVHFCFITDC